MIKTKNAAAVTAAMAAFAALGVFSSEASARGTSSSSAMQASLESRLNAMESEMQALRSELAATKAEAKRDAEENAQQISETKQQAVQTQQQVVEATEHEKEHHDLLFFRGGFTHADHGRNNELLINNSTLNALGATTYNQQNTGDGWYVGAGFDHRLTDDLWGLTDVAALDGEVMFQYMDFGTSQNTLVEAGTGTIITGNALTPGVSIRNQLTQFILSASPKLKFNLLDGNLRPWIIPFGLSISVISPPSSGVTVINPGLMLGTGMEYRLWESLWAGVDFRYNFTGGNFNYKGKLGNLTVLNETSIDGLMAGAYLGLGF